MTPKIRRLFTNDYLLGDRWILVKAIYIVFIITYRQC